LAHTLAVEARTSEACDHEMLMRELTASSLGAGGSLSSDLHHAGADAGAGPLLIERAATPRMQVGMRVTVLEAFRSDSTGRVLLRPGERGCVIRVDDRGDVLVDFRDHPLSQWIFKANHCKLHAQPVKRPVGAVILLAPLISVAAVIQHHVPSEFAASLVGPMWEVLEMVKNDAMEHVPLFIIHPKNDEIVPSAHGQALFEQSTSRHKFGVWLCNATHNIALDEDHLRIARNFFDELLGASDARHRVQGTPKLDGESGYSTLSDPSAVESENTGIAGKCEGSHDVEIMRIADRLIQLGLEAKAEDAVVMSL